MPTKIATETQLSRLLGNTPLQVNLTLLQVSTHKAKNVSEDHMLAFYKTFADVKDRNFDGFIITGAPVEQMKFEEVEYWDELCEIMEWTKTHVHSTLHICWGAQAALYYHFGIDKKPLDKKLFGVFKHKVVYKNPILLRGFDDEFWVPHSRHTTIDIDDLKNEKKVKILASSKEAGLYAAQTKSGKQVFITGHSEYDADTLKTEYLRDKSLGKDIDIPINYFPDDNPNKSPKVKWRGHANLLYSNWLNYLVYQTTPYDLNRIK
jgi:homoserine O-succinyltransferase